MPWIEPWIFLTESAKRRICAMASAPERKLVNWAARSRPWKERRELRRVDSICLCAASRWRLCSAQNLMTFFNVSVGLRSSDASS